MTAFRNINDLNEQNSDIDMTFFPSVVFAIFLNSVDNMYSKLHFLENFPLLLLIQNYMLHDE